GAAGAAGAMSAYWPKTKPYVPELPPRATSITVAPVDVSVMVRLPPAVPTVTATVPAVSPVIVGVPIEAPVPPLTVNKPAAVSLVQSVLVPVSVTVWIELRLPNDGVIASAAVATDVAPSAVPVTDSVTKSVPVFAPVGTTTVAEVPDATFWFTLVTPVMPESVNTVEPVHEVPVPVSVRVIFPECLAGIVEGETVMLPLPALTTVSPATV